MCREPIHANAKRCVHCQAFQDWRRMFWFNEVHLSLLIALASVLTVALPVIRDEFWWSGAVVQYTLISCQQDAIAVLAMNSGDRIAAVSGGKFRHFVEGSLASSTELYVAASEYPVLAPNTARELRLTAREDMQLPARAEGVKECTYEVTLELAAFEREAPELESRTCPCPG